MNLIISFLILTCKFYLLNGQTSVSPIILVQPSSCSSSSYFDISHLQCLQCPQNSIKSDSKFFNTETMYT
jgi:hypothetical protein